MHFLYAPWQPLYAHVTPIRHHVTEKAVNFVFHFVIVAEAHSNQMLCQLEKQVASLDYKMVGDDASSKLLQESDGLMGDMGASIVVENAYTFAQYSSSPILNHPSEVFQCPTVPIVP